MLPYRVRGNTSLLFMWVRSSFILRQACVTNDDFANAPGWLAQFRFHMFCQIRSDIDTFSAHTAHCSTDVANIILRIRACIDVYLETVGLGTNSGTVSVTARSQLNCRVTVSAEISCIDVRRDATNGRCICVVWTSRFAFSRLVFASRVTAS